ncbi:MmgE/PrpD family protein [Pseudarthrobacter sp. fls2-241-R2A-168]|uniref:MmgE/PrpD family protein n=1 Tax=Pseudarthrobacter sp. fls2-241-R2A-168 TaxID=3040304 RepID=UPI00255344BD|nr:MmgE/PrpD family protein [Pseudarthrobacter sp. fls2-241-R2A-168]
MRDHTAGATAQLARFASTLTWDQVPPSVREHAARQALDGFGAIHAGSGRPWTNSARQYALQEGKTGCSSVIGTELKLRPALAAFVNATAMHGFELDDYHVPAAVHAGCAVIPTVLALADEVNAGSHATLTAIAAGTETIIRLGLSMSPEMTQDRGFHVTSAFGAIGAAVAAANLLRLDQNSAQNAIGIAAAQAGGTTEFTRSGGEIKRVHAGFAASNGIRAADLARLGLTAPLAAIEGPKGFAQAFGGRCVQLEHITRELGKQWHLDGLGIKSWSTCTGNHAPIAALEILRRKGLKAADVASITVYTDRTTAEHCGHVGAHATDVTGAQFSLHLSLAMRLVMGGNDPKHYAELEAARFAIPEVTSLAEKVDILVGEEEEAAFSTAPSARLVIKRSDGTEMTSTAIAPGGPSSPFSWDELKQKVHACADQTVGPGAVEETARYIRSWMTMDQPVRGLLGDSHSSANSLG